MRINEDYIEDLGTEEIIQEKPDYETDFVVPQMTSLIEQTGFDNGIVIFWIDSFEDESTDYAIDAMRPSLDNLNDALDRFPKIIERSKFIVGAASLDMAENHDFSNFSKWLVTNEEPHNDRGEKFVAFSFRTSITKPSQMILMLYRMAKLMAYNLQKFTSDVSFTICFRTDLTSSGWTRMEVVYEFIKDVYDAAEEADMDDDSSWQRFSRYVPMFMPFMKGGVPKYPRFEYLAQDILDNLEDYIS